MSIPSKVTPSSSTLDLKGINQLLIVRCESNLATLVQVVTTTTFELIAVNLSFLDSSQSRKKITYGVTKSYNFSICG